MAMLPFTQKANEALVAARDLAVAGQHPEILPQHLFASILVPERGLRPILEKAGLAPEAVAGVADAAGIVSRIVASCSRMTLHIG